MGAINETIVSLTQEMIIPSIKTISSDPGLSPIQKLLILIGLYAVLATTLRYSSKLIGISITGIAYVFGTYRWIIHKIKGKEI